MEMLVTKFSKGKYRNEGDLFAEPISADNVKLMGEMIALQALRTVKKFDMKVADRLYIGLIKDLHHRQPDQGCFARKMRDRHRIQRIAASRRSSHPRQSAHDQRAYPRHHRRAVL